jgi:GrpB-like predicted nucleotidyltransferase (UPF0157 family)
MVWPYRVIEKDSVFQLSNDDLMATIWRAAAILSTGLSWQCIEERDKQSASFVFGRPDIDIQHVRCTAVHLGLAA